MEEKKGISLILSVGYGNGIPVDQVGFLLEKGHELLLDLVSLGGAFLFLFLSEVRHVVVEQVLTLRTLVDTLEPLVFASL